jgi:hypothetical protein
VQQYIAGKLVNERINLGGIQSDERECSAMNVDELR